MVLQINSFVQLSHKSCLCSEIKSLLYQMMNHYNFKIYEAKNFDRIKIKDDISNDCFGWKQQTYNIVQRFLTIEAQW